MLFVLSASTTVLLQLLGPVVLVFLAWLALRRSPYPGWTAAGSGAALFVSVMLAKLQLRSAGVDFSDWPLLYASIGIGVFASVSEEVIRFGAVLLIFRAFLKPNDGPEPFRLLPVVLLFGLGWGGIETMILGLESLVRTVEIVETNGEALSRIPIEAVAVMGLGSIERLSAIAFHVGISVWAARAARDAFSGRFLIAAGIFLGALVIHAGLDAMVHFFAVPAKRALLAGDYGRGLREFLVLEAWFAAGALASLYIARRLDDAASSFRRESVSPGS